MKQTSLHSFFKKKDAPAKPAEVVTPTTTTTAAASADGNAAATPHVVKDEVKVKPSTETPAPAGSVSPSALKRKRDTQEEVVNSTSETVEVHEVGVKVTEETSVAPQSQQSKKEDGVGHAQTKPAPKIAIPEPTQAPKNAEAIDAESYTGPTSHARLIKEQKFTPFFNAKWPGTEEETAAAAAAGGGGGAKKEEPPAPYAFFADVCAEISAVGSRLECQKKLTQFFWAIMARRPSDMLSAVYLATNKQAPAHEGVELGIGDATLIKAVAEACSLTEKRCKELYQQTGDLAEIAQDNKKKIVTLVKPKPLGLAQVQKTLFKIATMQGKDVTRKRIDTMKVLLRDAKGPEVNFLVRALQGKMRIGLAEPTVVQCMGFAFALHHIGPTKCQELSEKEVQVLMLQGATQLAAIYHQVPSWDIVVPVIVKHGFDILTPGTTIGDKFKSELSIRAGLPVRPMLAHPTNGITAVLNRFEGKKFTCEYKYDGERAQIHYKRGEGFSIYSRNSETHTTKYPDIINMMPTRFNDDVESFILDSEVVAIDTETARLQAFQVLQHRGRKNIDINQITIRVCVFAFDLMFLNGEPLLPLSLEQRRELLYANFKTNDEFRYATHINTDETEEIQAFLEKSVVDGCEGLMVKTLEVEAEYTPNKRSHYWLKLKKDYMEGVTDTVDLVPIGAFLGKGKRTGVFGGFLLAVYDPESEEYQSICKIGTGFKDHELESLTTQLNPHKVEHMPSYYRVHEKNYPDVWLNEAFVWECKAADLSISPVHFAGVGLCDSNKGIALRFPRFLKLREDKGPVDATSAAQIADMYKQQALATTGGGDEALMMEGDE